MQRGSARGGSGQFEPQAAARSSGCVARGLGQINASLVSTNAREAWAEPEGAGGSRGALVYTQQISVYAASPTRELDTQPASCWYSHDTNSASRAGSARREEEDVVALPHLAASFTRRRR